MTDTQVSQNIETQMVVGNDITIQVTQEVQEQTVVGLPGPAGPSGATLSSVAGQILSGHRIVTYNEASAVVYASFTDSSARRVVGMTLGAAVADDVVFIQTYGRVVEPSWNWLPLEPVYLGADGMITQVAPVTDYCVQVGFALDAHTIMLTIESVVKLT